MMATVKYVNLSLDDVHSILSVQKTPLDVANNIKSYGASEGNSLDKDQMLLSALSTLEIFASAISKYETPVPGTTLSSASLLLNLAKANDDIDKYGNITNGTLNSIIADLSSLTANAGLALKNPYVVGAGITASVAFSVAAFVSDDGDTWMADSVVEFTHILSENFNAIQDSLNTYAEVNNTNVDSIIGECLKTQNVVQTQYNESINTNSSLAEWLKQDSTKIKLDSAYGKVIIQKTTDGNSIFIVPNSDVTSTTYGTFTDGFENQVYCEKEVA